MMVTRGTQSEDPHAVLEPNEWLRAVMCTTETPDLCVACYVICKTNQEHGKAVKSTRAFTHGLASVASPPGWMTDVAPVSLTLKLAKVTGSLLPYGEPQRCVMRRLASSWQVMSALPSASGEDLFHKMSGCDQLARARGRDLEVNMLKMKGLKQLLSLLCNENCQLMILLDEEDWPCTECEDGEFNADDGEQGLGYLGGPKWPSDTDCERVDVPVTSLEVRLLRQRLSTKVATKMVRRAVEKAGIVIPKGLATSVVLDADLALVRFIHLRGPVASVGEIRQRHSSAGTRWGVRWLMGPESLTAGLRADLVHARSICMSICMLPLIIIDLRRAIRPLVTWSDAFERGVGEGSRMRVAEEVEMFASILASEDARSENPIAALELNGGL